MDNELFHSDIYLGVDFSVGLRHFKYIKRERKGNGWVYYYNDYSNKLSNLERDVKRQSEYNDKAWNNAWENRRKQDLRNAKDQTGRDNVNRWYDDPSLKKSTRKTAESRWDRYNRPEEEYVRDNKSKLDSLSAEKEKREKSVGGKIDKFMQKNGSSIAKAMNSVSGISAKGSEFVSKKRKNLADYKNALSSKDEEKNLHKVTDVDKNNESESNKTLRAISKVIEAENNKSPEASKYRKAYDDYEEAATFNGKMKAVKDTYKRHRK